MSDFTVYLGLGWEHIVSQDALDHLLFLAVLVAPYALKDWRRLLLIVTGFTIGHSVSLALASAGKVKINSGWVEFLIPITIIIAALANLFVKSGQFRKPLLPAFIAIVFGLIHGLGFANTLKFLAGSQTLAIPLLGFSIGIELGQITVVILLLFCCFILVNQLRMRQDHWRWILSVPSLLTAIYLAGSRLPF